MAFGFSDSLANLQNLRQQPASNTVQGAPIDGQAQAQGDWFAQFEQQNTGVNGGGNAGGQNWDQASFSAQFGTPNTPQELIALEGRLAQQGIKVLRNAEGTAGKIQLPNGQIVDVIVAAGAGGRGFTWDTGAGGQSAGGFGGGGGEMLAPYTKEFKLPSLADLQGMPGYQAGLDASQKAVERSAASRGTLLTGRTPQAVSQAAIDYAGGQYSNLAALSMGAQDRNYNVFRNNQNDPYEKLSGLARLGAGSAAAS